MQDYKPTTIQSRSFAEKTLTYHEEIALKTLVVNLSSREMPKYAKKILLSTSVPHLKDQIPNKGSKIRSHKRVSCVSCQNKEKTPQYILYHDL
jgi:hypothetical protein